MSEKSENNLIEWIRNQVAPKQREGVVIDLGDDMAMLAIGPEGLLVATDMLMDGVDFDTRKHSPAQIGRKAMAVNLSDCAAMAVQPRFALVSVALNDAWGMDEACQLFSEMNKIAGEFGCSIVGGDTNSWSKPLVIDVTMIARPYEGITPVRRSGARPGDSLYVTGRLGGSIAGHHMTFVPRVAAAEALARILGNDLHAMMDVSDGLSTDGHRLAQASSCGILLDSAALTRVGSEAARRLSQSDGRSVIDQVLNDGEDFELLFAASPGHIEGLSMAERERLQLSRLKDGFPARIGEVTGDSGLFMRLDDGQQEPVPSRGWQHFR